MFTRTFAIAAVGATLAAAQQNPVNITEGCKAGLAGLLAAPEASCFNPGGLVSLVIGTQADTSIVDPINNWLTGLCGVAPCTNASLASIVTNVTTACQQEFLAETGGADTSAIIAAVQEYYPIVRETICLKDDAKSQLCLTQDLTNAQDILGPLSLNGVTSIMTRVAKLDPSAYKNITCTNCLKATLNTVRAKFPNALPQVDSVVQEQCGASFTDGSAVTGISQTAVTQSSTIKSGASSLLASGAASLLAVSVLFATLL